jgi:hypothetical protein
MKTAVEWLIEKHINQCGVLLLKDIEQAKEMEKEQIKDAYNDGVNDECIGGSKTPEKYYKETFKSE